MKCASECAFNLFSSKFVLKDINEFRVLAQKGGVILPIKIDSFE